MVFRLGLKHVREGGSKGFLQFPGKTAGKQQKGGGGGGTLGAVFGGENPGAKFSWGGRLYSNRIHPPDWPTEGPGHIRTNTYEKKKPLPPPSEKALGASRGIGGGWGAAGAGPEAHHRTGTGPPGGLGRMGEDSGAREIGGAGTRGNLFPAAGGLRVGGKRGDGGGRSFRPLPRSGAWGFAPQGGPRPSASDGCKLVFLPSRGKGCPPGGGF